MPSRHLLQVLASGLLATFAAAGPALSEPMDPDGDVCLTWQHLVDGQKQCFLVTADKDRLTWSGKPGEGRGTLRGGVSETFITP